MGDISVVHVSVFLFSLLTFFSSFLSNNGQPLLPLPLPHSSFFSLLIYSLSCLLIPSHSLFVRRTTKHTAFISYNSRFLHPSFLSIVCSPFTPSLFHSFPSLIPSLCYFTLFIYTSPRPERIPIHPSYPFFAFSYC
jgi:hypothetical protein